MLTILPMAVHRMCNVIQRRQAIRNVVQKRPSMRNVVQRRPSSEGGSRRDRTAGGGRPSCSYGESEKKKTMREDGRGQRTVYLQTTKQRRRDVRHACAVRKPSVSGKRRFSRTYTETPGSGAFSPTPPGRPETALSPAYGRLAAFSAFIAMSVRKCRPANRMRSALS